MDNKDILSEKLENLKSNLTKLEKDNEKTWQENEERILKLHNKNWSLKFENIEAKTKCI